MKFINTIAFSLLVLSCGGGNDSNETGETEQRDNPNPGKKEISCDTEFCRNNLVVPSVNNAGEFVQVCAEGEIFVNDNCAQPTLNVNIKEASFQVKVGEDEYAYIDARLNSRTTDYYDYVDEKIVPNTGSNIFDTRLQNLYDFKGYKFEGVNALQFNVNKYTSKNKSMSVHIDSMALGSFFQLEKFYEDCKKVAKKTGVTNYGSENGECLILDEREIYFRMIRLKANCNNHGCYISEVTLYKDVNDEAKE